MKTVTNRREALKTTIAAGIAVMIPTFIPFRSHAINDENNESTLFNQNAYLVKHGNPVQDASYLWSVLTFTNEQQFLSQIEAIISQNNYFSKLAYNTNDKFKIVPSKQIIDLILDPNSGVSFSMTYFRGNPTQFTGLNPMAMNQKKSNLYGKLLSNRSNLKIIEKVEDRFGPSDAYSNKFSELHNATHEAINPKFDPLIQVNDLISGICYSIMTNKLLYSSTKLELNSYFNSITKLSDFRNNNLVNLPNITITKELV